jgi:hypothetical protein
MSKQRWKDTLPVLGIRPSLLMASQHLVNAMAWGGLGRTAGDRERAAAAAAFAAAHIRAYRKTLGVEGAHRRSACQQFDEGALLAALESVAAAALADDPHTKAVWCRYAEADLRELWKRGQA